MSQPQPYTPTTDFSQQEANNASGRSTVNTAALDAEFANIETTLDQVVENSQLIQRDDGKLGDVLVEVRCLAPDTLNLMGGFNLTGLWVALTDYAVNDIASSGEYTYVCKTAHTSGAVFEETNWIQFGFTAGADAAQAAAAAQVSASNAATSATTATAQAASAISAAGSATAAASSATASANSATTSAGSASISAANAANSATAASVAVSGMVLATDLASTASGKGSSVIGRSGQVVSSIAAIRALLKTSASTHAFVTGYYIQGDGGGGAYWYDSTDTTSADNGGTVIVATDGGRWKLSQQSRVSVKQFGAKGDGVANDTAFMVLAHATGKLIDYPAGTYLLTEGVLEIVSGGIIGAGPTQTIIKSANVSTGNLIKLTGALGSYSNVTLFRDFTLQADVSKASGAGIQVFPASGEASYLDFRNVHTLYCPIGFDFVAASLWKAIGCNFLSYTVAGVQVANTNVADSGDSVISSCVFNTPYTTGSGVWQKSSGGLKIIGNKFLGGLRGYTMNLEGSTSVLIISGNSFENMTGQDIVFAQGTVGQNFVNVAITGNEFSVGGIAISTDAANFLSEVVITGNNINMGAAGSNPCISLNTVTDFFIGANIIKGNGGAGSSAVNITSCVNGKIGPNTYANLPTPIVITTSPTVAYELDSQSGSSTTLTTGWGGYGTLFASAAVSVTFPRAFLMTPAITDLTITPGSSNGTLGGFVTAISKTGFTYQTISSVTGIAATVYWKCKGVL